MSTEHGNPNIEKYFWFTIGCDIKILLCFKSFSIVYSCIKEVNINYLSCLFPFQCYRIPLLEFCKLEARFVLRPGQHVNNMEENTNYRNLQWNSLGQILKIKAFLIQTNEKGELVNLYDSAEALNLPPIDQNDFSMHVLEDGQSKVKRIWIRGTVPRWTGRKICELCHLCVLLASFFQSLSFTILFARYYSCPGNLARFVPFSSLLRKSALRTITLS